MRGYTAAFHDDESFLEWARAIKKMFSKYIMYINETDLSFSCVSETATCIHFTIKKVDDEEGTLFTTSNNHHERLIEAEIISSLAKGVIIIDSLLAIED